MLFYLSPCVFLEICRVLSSLRDISEGKCVGFEIKFIPLFCLVAQGAVWKSLARWK